jgi:hypothetical protein
VGDGELCSTAPDAGVGKNPPRVLSLKEGARQQVSPIPQRQEVTMQLRHIRPGSLEWQDAKTEEVDQSVERLTPEEISHLRALSEQQRSVSKEEEPAPLDIH